VSAEYFVSLMILALFCVCLPATLFVHSVGNNLQSNQAIKYLEAVVKDPNRRGNKDPAIHNYLLSLYAKVLVVFVLHFLMSLVAER
jgi:hypothetical protein